MEDLSKEQGRPVPGGVKIANVGPKMSVVCVESGGTWSGSDDRPMKNCHFFCQCHGTVGET